MEKRLRDYLRHLEKIDYDLMTEEEVWEEREMLQLRLQEIHQEMVRILIPMVGILICACIFLAAGFENMFVGDFACSGLMAIIFIWLLIKYKNFKDSVKQLCAYIDRLTVSK